VLQDVVVRELGLLNDTEYELQLLEDEGDSNTGTGWTDLKTTVALTDDKLGLSSELDCLFSEF
jgi:hypothetical protein